MMYACFSMIKSLTLTQLLSLYARIHRNCHE